MSDDLDMDGLEDLEDNDADGAGSGDAPPADGGSSGSKESKRINDLMSKWQSSEARNAQLEARLKALEGKGSEGDAADQKGENPEVQAWIEAQRDFARERAFGSDPRLAAYGLTSEDIAGDTPADMKAAVKRYVDLIGAIETKVRNALLVEYGLTPDGSGSSPIQKVDVNALNDEDFEKLVRKAKGQL